MTSANNVLLPNKRLGKLVRAKRKALGVGLREFAEKAGCDYTAVHRLEHGHDVRVSTVMQIIKAHGIDVQC